MSENIYICIVEGKAEQAIIEILLENDLLIFKKDDLLDSTILGPHYRTFKRVEDDYLSRSFDNNPNFVIYNITDSIKNIKVSKDYRDKVLVKDIVTKPEIEILYIISVGKMDEYTNKYKSNMKPSQYVKQILKVREVKSYNFVKQHFSQVSLLIETLKKYPKKKGQMSIIDLFKK